MERKVNMKKNYVVSLLAAALALFVLFSCSTLKELGLAPSVSLKAVSLASVDFDGITFNCDYSVSNPLPVGISIKKVAADVVYESNTFTSLTADEGVKVKALGSQTNKLSFKVPYDTILSFASSSKSSSKTSLPFKINGKVSLDFNGAALAESLASDLPFSVDFDVPVFKPSLSLSNPKVQLPSLTELKDSFVSGGMNIVKAATVAAAIIGGQSVADSVFDGIDLDFKVSFNLNVANSGSAPWKYVLNSCSLTTSSGNAIQLDAGSNNEITSSSGTIPVTAKLNTLTAGKFIVQLLNKKGGNPTFTFDSGLSFTELSYAPNIPLAYSKEVPLSNFGISK